MSSKDNLGDRIKQYERIETRGKLIPMLPTVVRLDGRSFSKFTKSFEPFDEDMLQAMVATTKFLVEESNAVIGYTQSDEITLILYTDIVVNTYDEAESNFMKSNEDSVRVVDLDDSPTQIYTSRWKLGIFGDS